MWCDVVCRSTTDVSGVSMYVCVWCVYCIADMSGVCMYVCVVSSNGICVSTFIFECLPHGRRNRGGGRGGNCPPPQYFGNQKNSRL